MNVFRIASALCFAAMTTSFCHAATEGVTPPSTPDTSEVTYSSSALPEAPMQPVYTSSTQTAPVIKSTSIKPFSKVGVGVVFGVGGVGLELATPIAQKLNIRASGDFFAYSPNLTVSGITVDGTINFRTVNTSLDWFPFGGSFRISPGVTVYNGNQLSATAQVPLGTTFTLNDQTFVSGTCNGYNSTTGTCPANPTYTAGSQVSGAFNFAFGNKVAPSITLGWGNLVPRKASSHWSVPFEIGMEYIGTPLVTVALTGSACQVTGNTITGCGSINTGTNLSDLNAQVATINNDVKYLQTYPILKLGVGYKF